MSNRNYWLDLFSWETWQEFLTSGSDVSGFREGRWNTVQQMKPGDYLLCYMTGISRFFAILEVTSEPFKGKSPIWKRADFPCRVKVKVIASLTPDNAIPVLQLKDNLSVFENLKSPFAWTGRFRGSPAKWKSSDGEAVVNAVLSAQNNPTFQPVDPAKLGRSPKVLNAKIGPVTVPENADVPLVASDASKETTAHTEIQWQLLKLGSDMGFDVWVARNDRNRECNGHKFTDLPRLKKDLPLQFDEATNRTIELIDVLWLKGNAIVSAFEVESTTSIYSGLLRMSDLIAMQPNLNIPLYLVAPDDRRDKVTNEVNRPTFSRLDPPMYQMCRFISFTALRNRVEQATEANLIKYLKPEFLEELSESCEIEDA
jgi:EVE domain